MRAKRVTLARQFFDELTSKGVVAAARRTSRFFRKKIGISPEKIQVEVSKSVNDIFGGVVAYGPFKGLRLKNENWINDPDRNYRAAILLGLFEQEILETLKSIPSTHKTFINVGAGHGLYSIGVLIHNTFDISHSYEVLEQRQKYIESNARLNKVHDRVRIHGAATRDSFEELRKNHDVDLSKCVILCDIEGGEFDLFDEKTFVTLKGSIIIIELHEFFVADGEARVRDLKRAASTCFRITELTTGARDLSQFPEIKMMSDTERWLIVSELRPRLMTWLRLDPK
jgi:hypothetical protein